MFHAIRHLTKIPHSWSIRDRASSSLISSRSRGLKIYIEQSFWRLSMLKGSGSSEADIIVHGATGFQSKSDTLPMWPMWLKIVLSSQKQFSPGRWLSNWWHSTTWGLSALAQSSGEIGVPSALFACWNSWSAYYYMSLISQKIKESPDEAKYCELELLNLTVWTFDLCLCRVPTMGLCPELYLFAWEASTSNWLEALLVSINLTKVSLEPVAT